MNQYSEISIIDDTVILSDPITIKCGFKSNFGKSTFKMLVVDRTGLCYDNLKTQIMKKWELDVPITITFDNDVFRIILDDENTQAVFKVVDNGATFFIEVGRLDAIDYFTWKDILEHLTFKMKKFKTDSLETLSEFKKEFWEKLSSFFCCSQSK